MFKNILICLKLWLASVFLLSQMALADDIDLYFTVDNEGATTHNILFSLDTSGSMGWLTPTIYSGGNYDPNKTYGDGSSDGRIYIYDEDLNFTGESFAENQNVCGSMDAVFNTAYPLFTGKVAQWKKTTTVVSEPGDCEEVEVGGSTEVKNKSEYTGGRNEDVYNYFSIDGNAEFKITVEANRSVYGIEIYSTKSNGKQYKDYGCNIAWYSGRRFHECSGTIKNNHRRLYVKFTTWAGGARGFTTNYKLTLTKPGSIDLVCDDPSESTVETNNWLPTISSEDNVEEIVECKEDAGQHGINDGSSLTYAKQCSYGDVCNSPLYTNKSSQKLSFSREKQNFVPANFHDYLQDGGEILDIASLPTENPSTFCGGTSTNNNLKIFRDSTSPAILQCRIRIEVMKEAINNLIASLDGSPINIGLQRFNSSGSGGTILDAVEPLEDNKDDFLAKMNALPATGSTPLQETLWEAYRYYAGKSRDYGSSSTTDSKALNGSSYRSPISSSCQSNNVILLTDGEPTYDTGKASSIKQLSGKNCSTSTDGDCLDELAGYMNSTDFSSIISGKNNVTTYTIGFALDLPLLQSTANQGGGQNFVANDTIELTTAFKKAISDILSEGSTFVAPAVSVNAFNELQHRNELYYALFEPNGLTNWSGNIKKFRLIDGKIVDDRGVEAVDKGTGFFKDTSQSIWSLSVDGSDVKAGGAASHIGNSRNIYTEINSSLKKLEASDAEELSAKLDIANGLSSNQVVGWMLGRDVLDADGDGSFNDAHNVLADPLHSEPTVITYGGTATDPNDVLFFTTNLGTLHAVDPDDASGQELWAYWPKEHHDNAAVYMEPIDQEIREYGLDGQMTFLIDEAEGSSSKDFSVGKVRTFFGERRGGSRYYALDVTNARKLVDGVEGNIDNSYSAPFKVLWKITGSLVAASDQTDLQTIYEYNANISEGFSDLAQTWSKMIPATIKIGGEPKEVLIFSGGYDPSHDDPSYLPSSRSNENSEYGNAIYIVDQENGQLLFSIGNNGDARNARAHTLNADMLHSIPASPTVIDSNRDGYADIIFAVDIVGNVWRVDFDGEYATSSSNFGSVGKIANLSDIDENRKFYNPIDVSRSSAKSGSRHYNLIVGSGYRANPREIESSVNRLYVLFDDYISARTLPSNEENDRYNYFEYESNDTLEYRMVTADDLVKTTTEKPVNKFTYRIDSATNQQLDQTINGFYVEFSSGEKVLQSTVTFNSRVLFATYLPAASSNSNNCNTGQLGSGKLYLLDLQDGQSLLDEDTELLTPGIPVDPSIIITGGDQNDLVVCVATHCFGGEDKEESDETNGSDEGSEEDKDKDEGGDNLFEWENGTAVKTYWREQ